MTSRPKKDIELVVTPSDAILFRGNFTESVTTAFIEVANPTPIPVAYKVKTTAPRRYCVRPNSGKLAPSESNQVKILLQPNQNNEDLMKHKFLIQTIDLTDEIFENIQVDDIFKDRALTASAASRKLLCKFEPEYDSEPEIEVGQGEGMRCEPLPVVELEQVTEEDVLEQPSKQEIPVSRLGFEELESQLEPENEAEVIEQPSEHQLGQDVTEPEPERVEEPIIVEENLAVEEIDTKNISDYPLPNSILHEAESEQEIEIESVEPIKCAETSELPGIINNSSKNIVSSTPLEPQIINQEPVKKPVVAPKMATSPNKKSNSSDKNFTTISTEELRKYKSDIQDYKDKLHAKEQEALKANREKREAIQQLDKISSNRSEGQQTKNLVQEGQNQPFQDLVLYRVVFIIAILAFLFGYLMNGLTCSC